MHYFLGYLMVVGGVSAGLQVTRGVVRGAGRLLGGDARGALAEVAGGVAAPVRTVCHEACKLAADVFIAATAISGGGPAPVASPQAPARQRAEEPELDGVAA